MRILHMILSLTGGGAERQLALLAGELADQGHDVHVAYVYGGVQTARLNGNRCTMHQVTVSGKWDVRLLMRSVSLMRRLRPDVVHTWLAHMDVVGGGTARLLRIPWVMSERSAALNYSRTLLYRARLAVGKGADLIVSNSEGGAEYWTAHGVERSRIEIVPNFVPLEEIESAPPLRDARISDDDDVVLYVGRLSPEKNLPVLIDAMQRVCAECESAKLVICGVGALLDELQARARQRGIEKRIVFAGFVSDIGSWLKRARAVVAVSLVEGHPNAVLEAVAVGVPVVVSDIPAYRSVLDAESASFVPVDEPQEIAAAVMRTLGNRQAAMERAMRAREHMRPLSLHAVATRYQEIYRRVVAGRRHR